MVKDSNSLSFNDSLKIQARVVWALLLREIITRYGRHGIGAIWLILEPMMFTLGVATLWYFTKLHTTSSISIFAFTITGYSSVLLWRNVSFRCSKAIEPNVALMFHRNVKEIDIFLSRIILEWAGVTLSFVLLILVFYFMNYIEEPKDYFLVSLAWLYLLWFSLGLGLIVGALSELSEAFERLWHVFTYLVFPLSGAVFMVDWLPQAGREIVLYLPMVHAVEMIRHGFFGALVRTYESQIYMIFCNIALLLLGLILVKKVSNGPKFL